ncbi:MAG: N-acetylglucosamine-6-phosphate deacetylase [Firmicutes bacterium]|nr:N-acetylglucosamine-6-phosphate deacetylase [Bacillota bacterium]
MKWIEGNRLTQSGQWQTARIGIDGARIAVVKAYHTYHPELSILAPGFIDIHVHGGGGADTMDATIEAFSQIAQTHAQSGTTSLLLTTVTESAERIDAVLTAASSYMKGNHIAGAHVLGVHLEGPFIHPDKAGAQRPDRIMDPDPTLAKKWYDSGVVKMITLAPERPGAHQVARMAHEQGIVAAAGHTTATAADMRIAVDEGGFSHVTHLCNAMRPLLHREPGPIGCVVTDERLTGDLICDGIHVDAPMVTTLIRAIGEDRLLLITDAIRATAQPPGIYDLGGLTVTVRDGACRLEDGTLAGSVLTMAQAVSGVQRLAGVSLSVALRLAARNPARRLGLLNKGEVEVGYDADMVCLDAQGELCWTMVGGAVVYERGVQGHAHSRV